MSTITHKERLISDFEIGADESAILSRIIQPNQPTLSIDAAMSLLSLDFSESDKVRMEELAARARDGILTPDEQIAIDNYERVGHMLNILQSKARTSLKARSNPL